MQRALAILFVLLNIYFVSCQIPANARVLLVDENEDTSDQDNIVNACPTCVFSVVEAALGDPSPFDNPIDTNFDMVVYLKSDDDWDDEAQAPTWVQNLEDFANTGRVVLLTQYDMLASNTDDQLIGLVGGSGSNDCSSWSGTIPDPFPTNIPECDLILNGGFFDLRGLQAGVNIDPNFLDQDDLDCETLISGVSFPCLRSLSYDPSDNVIWAVRPMANDGAVVWLSIDDDNDLGEYSTVGSVYYYALNNMFSFAEDNTGGGGPSCEPQCGPVTDVWYLDYESDRKSALERVIGVDFTVTYSDEPTDNTNSLMSPIPLTYDMVVVVKEDDDWDDEFEPLELARMKANIENYANEGGILMLTGYDALASSVDPFWVSVLGATGTEDCTSVGDIGTLSTAGVCDPLLNQINDIRGVDPADFDGSQSDDMDDEDCLSFEGGVGFSCLDNVDYYPPLGMFTIRPMKENGAIIFMTVDDDDDYNEFNSGFYRATYDNLLWYAARN